MTEVWKGSFAIPQSKVQVQDVQLLTLDASHASPISASARLSFIAVVHSNLIPLHFFRGPSLELHTQNKDSQQWISNILVGRNGNDDVQDQSQHAWWQDEYGQSPSAVLLQVEGANGAKASGDIDELLIYAASSSQGDVKLPTIRDDEERGLGVDDAEVASIPTLQIKIYVIPLCSSLAPMRGQIDDVLSSSEDPGSAYFISQEALQRIAKDHKKRKLSSVFDQATQQRRKSKHRGGASISHAMAVFEGPKNQQKMAHPSQPESKTSDVSLDHPGRRRGHLSRSPSVTSLAQIDSVRPNSCGVGLAGGKRSSLHMADTSRSNRESPSVPEMENETLAHNKASLSRVVMAGMRLHGLQQKRRNPSESITGVTNGNSNDYVVENGSTSSTEDDFKLIYHQTYKSAAFAFRSRIAVETLSQGIMQDLVDRLLDIFCPEKALVTDGFETGMSSQKSTITGPDMLASKSPNNADLQPLIAASNRGQPNKGDDAFGVG